MLYILKVYALALVLGLSIAFLIDYLFPNAESPVFELNIFTFLSVVLIAPVLETLIMIPIIALVRKVTSNVLYVSIISALTWSLMHSLIVPLWGIGVFALFFLMSMAYQYWDSHSRTRALLVVTMIHALNNASVFLIGVLENKLVV